MTDQSDREYLDSVIAQSKQRLARIIDLEDAFREWARELRALHGDPHRGTVLAASTVAEKIDALLGADDHAA